MSTLRIDHPRSSNHNGATGRSPNVSVAQTANHPGESNIFAVVDQRGDVRGMYRELTAAEDHVAAEQRYNPTDPLQIVQTVATLVYRPDGLAGNGQTLDDPTCRFALSHPQRGIVAVGCPIRPEEFDALADELRPCLVALDAQVELPQPRRLIGDWSVIIVDVPAADSWTIHGPMTVPPGLCGRLAKKTAARVVRDWNKPRRNSMRDGKWACLIKANRRFGVIETEVPDDWRPKTDGEIPPTAFRTNVPHHKAREAMRQFNCDAIEANGNDRPTKWAVMTLPAVG